MKLQLVTKEQSDKLIKLGFDWKCKTTLFPKQGEAHVYRHLEVPNYDEVKTPETALAIKWLREVKGLDVSIGVAFSPNWDKQYYPGVALNDLNYHDTYDEAEAAGLDYALDLLLRP